MNHPMGPPALEICVVADHFAQAARPVAKLGFLLRVLRPGGAARPSYEHPRSLDSSLWSDRQTVGWFLPRRSAGGSQLRTAPDPRPRALAGGAAQIFGCIRHTNPGCSRRARGRKIRRDFFKVGASKTLGPRRTETPRFRPACAAASFRRGVGGTRSHPRLPGYKPHGSAAYAWPKLETGGWGPTEDRRPAEDPRPLRANIWRVFKKPAKPNAGGFSGCALA